MTFLDGKIKLEIDGKKVRVNGKEITIGKNTKIEDGVEVDAQVIIGDNCVIEKGARIERSVIGSNVYIRPGAEILGSVLWDGVEMGSEARVKEVVLGKKTKLRRQGRGSGRHYYFG